jgi:heme/copper-type cytochrome/quinol oxidase subunit 2
MHFWVIEQNNIIIIILLIIIIIIIIIIICILLYNIQFIYNHENNQKDAICRLIYYSKSALHVSGNVFAHYQEHLTIYSIW